MSGGAAHEDTGAVVAFAAEPSAAARDLLDRSVRGLVAGAGDAGDDQGLDLGLPRADGVPERQRRATSPLSPGDHAELRRASWV
jgi:hypothetical protein